MIPSLPPGLIALIVGLCLFGWFCIGEQKSFMEKISAVFFVIAVVVMYRLANGDTLGNMLDIVREFLLKR